MTLFASPLRLTGTQSVTRSLVAAVSLAVLSATAVGCYDDVYYMRPAPVGYYPAPGYAHSTVYYNNGYAYGATPYYQTGYAPPGYYNRGYVRAAPPVYVAPARPVYAGPGMVVPPGRGRVVVVR